MPTQAISLSALPKETPCFQIQGIVLEDNVFPWLADLLKPAISGVLHRDATSRTGAQFKLFRKINRNYLDDTEIAVQRRDVVDYEASMSHRHYLGQVVLDGGFAWRETLPDHSNVPGVVVGDPGYGGRSQIETANASLYWPFKLASQVFEYTSNWSIQHVRTRVLPSDYFTIGSRHRMAMAWGPRDVLWWSK